MTREKLKLAFIENDAERRASYRKRKKGFMKKMNELTTLCGIDACAVIYSPYDHVEPEVWPSHMEAQKIVEKFQDLPEIDQNRKMVNHETFIRQRVDKAKEQLMKMLRENRRMEISNIISNCLSGNENYWGFNSVDLNDMGWIVNQKLMEINMRIEKLQGEKTFEGRIENGVYIGESSSSNEEKNEQSPPRTLALF